MPDTCTELLHILLEARMSLQSVIVLALCSDAPESLEEYCEDYTNEELAAFFGLPDLAEEDDEDFPADIAADYIANNKDGVLLTFHCPAIYDVYFDESGDVTGFAQGGCATWIITIYADSLVDGCALALRERDRREARAIEKARKRQGR